MTTRFDQRLGAEMESESRHPHYEAEPPARFRRQQFWVVVGIGVVVLVIAVLLTVR